MIDYTTIPLYDALPDVKALNYQNELLMKDNKILKKWIAAMAIGVIIYWGYQAYKMNKIKREED